MSPYEFYGWYRRNYNLNNKISDTIFLYRYRTSEGKYRIAEGTISSCEITMSADNIVVDLTVKQLGGIEEHPHISEVYFNTPGNYEFLLKQCKELNRKIALNIILSNMLSENITIKEIKEAYEDGRRRNSKKKSNNG